MKIEKKEAMAGTNIILSQEDKQLSISFEGNLDLYWTIQSIGEEEVKTLEITKEDCNLYGLFDELYRDIENINLYEGISEEVKERFRKYNMANYRELFNPEEKTITWYSDETNKIVANYLIIRKREDSFRLEFYTQEHIYGYEVDWHSKHHISIRFRNSGSQYCPFNLIFMKMYNYLENLKDIQEECLEDKKLVRNKA